MHLFMRSLQTSLESALRDAPLDVTDSPVREKTPSDTCTFNPKTRTIRIKVQPSRLSQRLDIAQQIGRKTFLLCLDVSGSMGGHAAEMVRILQQIEGELMQLQSFVRIRLLFFSDKLLGDTQLGDLASVSRKSGWLGNTEFGPPLAECLTEAEANPDTAHTVLFMTDGNSGYQPWQETADALVRRPNVRVISVGFGANFNDASLRRLSGDIADNTIRFQGAGASGELHNLLQSVVGCGIVLPTFSGQVTVGGYVISTRFHPFCTDCDETGVQACVALPVECAPAATLLHVVEGLVPETELTVITSDQPDRDATIMALHHALSAMRQSASADTDAKQLRTLAAQLQHWEAQDRRIAEVCKCVEQLGQTRCSDQTLQALQALQALERFVHALLSGASVSARKIKMVQKATDKLGAMMANIDKAAETMDSTRELVFEPRVFAGSDTLGSVMARASDQYPTLLLRNTRGCYENAADYERHLSIVADTAVTLIQPGTLCAPDYGGVLFPSELESTASPRRDELLRAIRSRTADAILCAGQTTPTEREYTRRMYRIVAALLSIGVPTCAGTNLCWNLGSAAMHAMSRSAQTHSVLVATTLMSYFRAFMLDQRMDDATMMDLYRTQPIRLYALTNRDDSPLKIENIWMSASVFYCLDPELKRPLLRPFGQGLVFESLRHAMSAKVKSDPGAINRMLNELVSTLHVGTVRYVELDANADDNPSTALWERPVDAPPDEHTREVFESLRSILRDSPVESRTSNLLARMRLLTAFRCPNGMSTSLTREGVDALLLGLLGATQARESTLPYWGGASQLLAICNGMSYFATTDAHPFGYISPDECQRLRDHTPLGALSDLYDSVDEFVTQVAYLLACGCNSRTIRETLAPRTLDELTPSLAQRPASAAPVEQARMSAFSRSLVAWASDHWSADELIALYSAVGGDYAPSELVEHAHRLAVQFQSPLLFGSIIRAIDVDELQPDSTIRRIVDARLREPFYAPTTGTLLAQLATRLEKGKSTHPILGSRRFNRILGELVRGLIAILDLPAADRATLTTVTLEQYVDAKKRSPKDPIFKKGGAHYLQHFRSISFYTSPTSNEIFVEKVGDLLERQVMTESRQVSYIWGVSEMFGLSRPECHMRALAMSHLQQARDHFARLASDSTHRKHRHYGVVLSHLREILDEDDGDAERH